jgi:hypothetical protein
MDIALGMGGLMDIALGMGGLTDVRMCCGHAFLPILRQLCTKAPLQGLGIAASRQGGKFVPFGFFFDPGNL